MEGNPVTYLDPFGMEGSKSYEDTVFWLGVVLAAITAKKVGQSKPGTFILGAGGSLSPGVFVFNGNLAVTVDHAGNYVVQGNFGLNFSTGSTPGASAGGFYGEMNAPNIDSLRGRDYNFGGTVANGVIGITLEGIVNDNEKTKETYYGYQVGAGVTTGSDVHAGYSYPKQIVKGNIYEAIKQMAIKNIME